MTAFQVECQNLAQQSVYEWSVIPPDRKLMLPAGDHRSFQVRMLQVDSYNVNRPSAHFHVLLDNEVYGPFYRIRVRPLRLPHAHSPVVSFPVRHFLPIS
ncbi:hypothetical protein RI054_04g22220 [Pseudoscourfieldia marina]